MKMKLSLHKYKISIKLINNVEVSDNKEIMSEKVKNKNKSLRNYIAVTVLFFSFFENIVIAFQWGCWDDKDRQKLWYQFYSRSLFFFSFFIYNKEEEIWENKKVRLEQ